MSVPVQPFDEINLYDTSSDEDINDEKPKPITAKPQKPHKQGPQFVPTPFNEMKRQTETLSEPEPTTDDNDTSNGEAETEDSEPEEQATPPKKPKDKKKPKEKKKPKPKKKPNSEDKKPGKVTKPKPKDPKTPKKKKSVSNKKKNPEQLQYQTVTELKNCGFKLMEILMKL